MRPCTVGGGTEHHDDLGAAARAQGVHRERRPRHAVRAPHERLRRAHPGAGTRGEDDPDHAAPFRHGVAGHTKAGTDAHAAGASATPSRTTVPEIRP